MKANGINMYYEVHGNAESLVLIAGLGADQSAGASIIGQLSLRFEVLSFDNRGVGRTDKPGISYSIEMMADDTADLMKGVGMEKAHVLGFSMGGRIAMALALQHPEMVRSLVLTSTFASRRRNNFPFRFKLVKWIRSSRIFGKSQQPYYAFVRQLEASRSYDCSDRLSAIHVPTLIMHGKQDRLVPFELAEEMHAGIRESKLVEFDGGHRFFFLKIKSYTDVVGEFLAEVIQITSR